MFRTCWICSRIKSSNQKVSLCWFANYLLLPNFKTDTFIDTQGNACRRVPNNFMTAISGDANPCVCMRGRILFLDGDFREVRGVSHLEGVYKSTYLAQPKVSFFFNLPLSLIPTISRSISPHLTFHHFYHFLIRRQYFYS